MRRLSLLLALLPCPAARAADEVPRPTGDAIVSPDAKLELLFTRTAPIKGGLTEGPAAAPDGSIYFSDIPFGKDKGMILRFDPKTKKTTVFAADSHKSNGLKFDARGFLIACEGSDGGGRCVSRWDVRTKKRTVIVDRYEGKRRTLHDFGKEDGCDGLCVDIKGHLYLTARSLKRPGVLVLDPSGEEVAFLPTGPSQPGAKEPRGIPSNCTFGVGAESKVLYVTVDKSLYRIRLLVEGYHPAGRTEASE